MEVYNAVVRFFQDGGLFMYPILVVLAFGAAIAIERYLTLTVSRARNQRTWNQIIPLLQGGHFAEARALADHSKTAIGRVASYGLSRLGSARSREDIELAMEEAMMEAVPRLEKRTHYLATLANIATLLGLLGTIIGLISAFTAVASASAADKADMLSASISVAMNTTAFGLMVGIPLLLVHALLQTKTTQLVDSLEMASVKMINSMNRKPENSGEREAAAA